MSSDSWRAAGLLLFLIGVLLRSYPVGLLGLLLLAVVGAAWLWDRYSLRAVAYTHTLSEQKAYVGETVTLETTLANRKPLALPWIRIEDQLDRGLEILGNPETAVRAADEWQISHTTSIGWYERVRWRYEVRCLRRGYHRIGPAMLESGDPFGFYSHRLKVPNPLGLLVYPQLLPLPKLDILHRHPFEGTVSRPAAVVDPLNVAGVRPYAEGDSLRQVHWRATARTNALQSKVWLPSLQPSLIIFLDLASSRHPWEGIDLDAVERAISIAATLATQAHGEGWSFGLFVNGLQTGARQRIRIPPARGDANLALVMEVLATVPPYPTHAFVDLLREQRHRIPAGAAVVAITVIPSQEVADQVELYRRAGIPSQLMAAHPAGDGGRDE